MASLPDKTGPFAGGPLGPLRVFRLICAATMLALSLTAQAGPWPEEAGPPPGERVSVGTHKLHIHCLGRGAPTVVLDAGLGGSSLEWTTVQKALSGHARVCAYDRAGYGWSDPGPRPRTSARNTAELRVLLTNAAIPGPYILVGHSYGGYTMQLFASRYPRVVRGLVLLDSSHAEQIERFEAPPIGISTAPRGRIVQISRPPLPDNLPPAVRPTIGALTFSEKTLRAIVDELQHFRLSAHQVRLATAWPNVPVVVLTRGERAWPDDRRGGLMEAAWMQMQTELAVRNPRSLHIVAKSSGHHIHLDQPELVVHAVKMILDENRRSMLRHATRVPEHDTFTTGFAVHSLDGGKLVPHFGLALAQ